MAIARALDPWGQHHGRGRATIAAGFLAALALLGSCATREPTPPTGKFFRVEPAILAHVVGGVIPEPCVAPPGVVCLDPPTVSYVESFRVK